jgi:hypothetical protein
MNYSAAD